MNGHVVSLSSRLPPPGDVLRVDGNAALGALAEVFVSDVSTALGECDHCHLTRPLAAARLHQHGPGLVFRCAGCDHVLFRVDRDPERCWLDLRGLRQLQLSLTEEV